MSFAGFNMKVKVDDGRHELILPVSNRRLYASGLIVGISTELRTFGGYDHEFPDCGPDLTQGEREDLANYMIDLWTQYKEKLEEKNHEQRHS